MYINASSVSVPKGGKYQKSGIGLNSSFWGVGVYSFRLEGHRQPYSNWTDFHQLREEAKQS
jgi:hypothetical protein